MRIAFAEESLESRSWTSMDEMMDHLSACDRGHVLLGEDAEQQNAFFSLEIRSGLSHTSSLGIGICSEGHGVTPQILLLPHKGQLLFGLNSEATSVSVKDRSVVYRIHLDWLFRDVIHVEERGIILLFYEIGVIGIDEDGEQLWSCSTDMIENGTLENAHLNLRFADSEPIVLDIRTGEEFEGTDKGDAAH